MTREELLKQNLIHLVEDHRAKCDIDCNVSLSLVREVAELAGLTLSQQERELFQ
jgi:hypothetical protein